MRRPLVVTDPEKAALSDVDTLAGFGTATVHEAMGRTGLVGPQFRPIQSGRPHCRYRGHRVVLAR